MKPCASASVGFAGRVFLEMGWIPGRWVLCPRSRVALSAVAGSVASARAVQLTPLLVAGVEMGGDAISVSAVDFVDLMLRFPS
jgi:hypothetical protein